jgi:nicotinamide-nucleotide amidase
MELFEPVLLGSIGKKLKGRKQTIAVAESVTAGLLQHALAQIPDASKFFQGGITSYNLGQKFKHLNVEPIHGEDCNCVSQRVADQMALQVVAVFNSDWGLAITGYATPVPESGNKLFAYYSIAFKNKIRSKGKLSHPKADPEKVQLFYVNSVLK